jgi:hypothetical protein
MPQIGSGPCGIVPQVLRSAAASAAASAALMRRASLVRLPSRISMVTTWPG